MQDIKEDPTYVVAEGFGMSQWTVWFTPVHVNEEGDPMRKLHFCRFILNSNMKDSLF